MANFWISNMQANSLKDWPILHNVTDTSNFRKIFVLGNRALILLNDGTIGGIGSNEHYLINEGSETNAFNNLTRMSTTTKFKDFTTNGNHALAISKEGFLYSWGTNENGQLGRNGPGSSVLLVSKTFAVRIKEAACGTGFSCVLTEDGRVFEWGMHGYNEFVLESHYELDMPDEAEENEEIVSIHATKHYVMILTKSGKVFLPSFKRLTNKCNINVHIEKTYAFGGYMKEKMIINLMTGKNYVFALTFDGEIFHWPAYSCNCNWEPNPKRVAENFGRFRKIWVAASDDVIVAADSFGNHYSITWNALEIMPSISKINFSSPGKYFSNLQMLLQGPVYDERTVDIVMKENDAVLNEWRGKFDAAFNNQEGSDISFIVDERIIYAHRAILSIQSTYLNAILRNEWKENIADKQIIIKEYSYPTYLRFMRFLYTGKLDPSSHEYTLASSMQSEDLKKWKILQNVNTSDVRKAFVFNDRAFILTDEGDIAGIGSNKHKLISDEDETTYHSTLTFAGKICCKDFTTNGEYILAISEEGFLYSWGVNEHGQLGRDGCSYSVLHVAQVFPVVIKEAACGTGFSCVLTDDGKVFEWGIYGFNEFVLQPQSEVDNPEEAEEREKIVSIYGAKNYLMILTESGKVFIPPFKRSINKCDHMTLHVEKVYAIEGPLKNKRIKQVLSGNSYSFALTCDGEIFHWPEYTCNCHNQPEPKRLAEEIEQVIKLWASTSHDVLVAANNIGNLYSITWKGPGILLSITLIDFPSAGSYFANLGMIMQGPVYDEKSVDIVIEETADVLKEWRGRFNAAFNIKEGTDITFIVGEGIIYAHRAILCIQSSFLNAILNNPWKEISENNQVVIKEYSYPTYLRFMKFIYTGKLELSSHESTLELLKLAHEYVEKPLLDLCKNMVIQGLTTENVLPTYNVAKLFGLEDVRLACKGFIGRNLKDVILCEDVLNQDEAVLLRCIRDMVCSKNIVFQERIDETDE